LVFIKALSKKKAKKRLLKGSSLTLVKKILFLFIFLSFGCTHNRAPFERGVENIGHGQINLAEKDFLKALRENPDDLHSRYNLSVLYQDTGRTGLAAHEYRRILKRNPSHTYSLINLAFIEYREGKVKEAISMLKRAQKTGSDIAKAALGTLYLKIGQGKEAQKAFTKIQKKHTPIVSFLEGELLSKSGRKKEALEKYASALEIDPDFSPAIVGSAKLLEEMADYQRAILKYKKVLSLEPKNPSWSFAIGKLYSKMGIYDEAAYYLLAASKEFKKGEKFKEKKALKNEIKKVYYNASRKPSQFYAKGSLEE